jgi:hypothetical protein
MAGTAMPAICHLHSEATSRAMTASAARRLDLRRFTELSTNMAPKNDSRQGRLRTPRRFGQAVATPPPFMHY